MSARTVPPPTAGRFDLARWFRDNVQAGDVVHFPELATYWTEQFTLRDHPDDITIQGHGATLEVRNPPAPDDGLPGLRNWNRPFELIGGNGLTVLDLKTKGCRPAGAAFSKPYEGQHAFSILGSHNTVLCDVAGTDAWGDGIYIGEDFAAGRHATDTIICQPRFTSIGRNASTTVGADGVLLYGPILANIGRTGFNLEVHPGNGVRNYEVLGPVLGHYQLNLITCTGSGDSENVTFRDILVPSHKKFTAVVAGSGAETDLPSGRSYGKRTNWRIQDVRGGLPHKGVDKYVKLLYVDGLALQNVPYPMQTTGSRLV